MAAIARRAILAAPAALLLQAADARQEITELLGDLATDFAAGNANGVIKLTAETMEDRERFASHVRAMIDLAQVSMSIEIREFTATGNRAQAKLDWYIELKRSGDGSLLGTERRRQWIACDFQKPGKRWRIQKVTPVEFFAPPAAR